MKKHLPLAAAAVIWLAAAGPASRPVPMTAQPGTELDATARRLVAAELKEAAQAGETPLVLVGSARIGGQHDRPALFVQLQSARECGSAGCSTSAYLFGPHGWQKVLDAATGPIIVDATRHHGMADLVVDRHDRWVWNGKSYADTRPAPVVNLKPRKST